MRRTPLKRGNSQLKRTVFIRQGKISKNNSIARDRIASIAEEKNLTACELKYEGCLEYYTLAPCHKHDREYYRGDVEKLSDPDEWICGKYIIFIITTNRSHR